METRPRGTRTVDGEHMACNTKVKGLIPGYKYSNDFNLMHCKLFWMKVEMFHKNNLLKTCIHFIKIMIFWFPTFFQISSSVFDRSETT